MYRRNNDNPRPDPEAGRIKSDKFFRFQVLLRTARFARVKFQVFGDGRWGMDVGCGMRGVGCGMMEAKTVNTNQGCSKGWRMEDGCGVLEDGR